MWAHRWHCNGIPSDELRRLARQESNGRVACRLIALANSLDGMSREQAARQAEMDRQTEQLPGIRSLGEGHAAGRTAASSSMTWSK